MKRGTVVNIEKTAAKIKQAIQSHGNDFEALAKKCNVKPATVKTWAEGRALPTVEHMYNISHALGLQMHDLIVSRPHKKESP